MGYIIKPLVTEKMTGITEKSSVDKTLYAPNAEAAKKLGAKEKKVSYVVTSKTRKRKGIADETKEKTVFPYTKPACPKYGFIVKPEANKIEIKKEVEAQYNVTVTAVNTCVYGGKSKNRYTRSGLIKGRTNAFKKAIVTLKEGDVIDFYSNI